MATWKKIIVSGSNISQLNNDSSYISAAGQGIISSSAQIATDISGSFTALSSSIAGRVTTEEVNVDVAQAHIGNIHAFTASADGEITALMAFTGSAARATAISGSSTSLSSSLASRITSQESFSASLDATFATEAELNTATSSLSASLAVDIIANENSITALDGEVTNLMAATGSQYAHIANLNTFTGSAGRSSAISGSFTSVSASIASDIASITTSFDISGSDGTGDTFNSGEALTFAGTTNEIETTVTNNQVQIGLPSNVVIGNDLTVTGNLTVTGTTTEQQVTNLNVEDQFILINSGAAAQDAGFVVNGQGAALGWDESENRFALDFAGATWNQTSITSDAFVAAVVTTDDANYQKVGNIRIDGENIYIYS